MLLIELATQAVKGFSSASRVPLKTGYNVVVPPTGAPAGSTPLCSALFYSDGRGGDAVLAAAANARAGLTLQGKDGSTYRLVRALGGAGALHRFEPSQTWSAISQDAGEITVFLRNACGLPSKAQFEELFCFSAQAMPSRRPVASAPAAAVAALGPQAATRASTLRANALVEAALAATAARPRLDPAKAALDLERLRAEVAAGQEIEDQQYQVEGMQRRLFELDGKRKGLDKLREEVEQARAAVSRHTLESLGLPPDAFERAARLDDASKKLDEAVGRLQYEAEDVQQRVGGSKPAGCWRDRQFLAGLGIGALALVLGVVLRDSGKASLLALLAIPAFGLAGLQVLRWIGELQGHDALGRKLVMSQGREQKLRAEFDNEYFPIKVAMKLIEVDTGKEFIEFFGRRQLAQEALEAAEGRLQATQTDPSFAGALRELETLTAQVKVLEGKIAELGASATRDWREAEREIAEIEEALRGGAPAGALTGAAALGGGSDATDVGGSGAEREDPVPRLLTLAQDLFVGATIESLGAALRDRASQYLVALSDRRYSGLRFDGAGRSTVSAPGREIAAGALSASDLDLLYLAVRLTIVEKQAAVGRMPVLLDEPFVGWDEPKVQLLSRMLKHIGTMTQVVHCTALPGHRGLADSAVQG